MNNNYNSSEFKQTLIEVGITKGDNVFIHSSLKTIGKYQDEENPDLLSMIKNSIFEIIGDKSFIAVPTFNFNFSKGEDFDINNSPSIGMGIFSEFIRNNKSSKRTSHPMHSISILGNNSEYISSLESETEFSEGSAFDYIVKKKTKILFLGNSFTTTFLHIAEEKAKVPYRFWKRFSGNVIKDTIKKKIDIKYYARRLEIEPEPMLDNNKILNFLENKKIMTKSLNNKINLMICFSNSYVESCFLKLKENPNYFLFE